MSQFFHVHPANPQARLIRQAADIILQGGVVAYPTDSAYALGCRLGNKEGLDGEVELMREGLGDPEPFGISRSVQHED